MEDESGEKEEGEEESLVCGSQWGRRKDIIIPLPSLEEEVRKLVQMQESGDMLIRTLFDEPGHELVRVVVSKQKERKENLNKGHRVASNW